jgi:hypothetical protein
LVFSRNKGNGSISPVRFLHYANAVLCVIYDVAGLKGHCCIVTEILETQSAASANTASQAHGSK